MQVKERNEIAATHSEKTLKKCQLIALLLVLHPLIVMMTSWFAPVTADKNVRHHAPLSILLHFLRLLFLFKI
jgi:hypothetical protein